MKNRPFELHVTPLHDASSSRLRLCGAVATAAPERTLRRWLLQLSRWSGCPVELVLPVDAGTAAWFESWTDAVSELPAHHLQIRFTLQRLHRPRRGSDGA
jgi:hypothetical protein